MARWIAILHSYREFSSDALYNSQRNLVLILGILFPLGHGMDLFGDNASHTWLSAQCVGHGLSVQATVHAMQAALLLPHVEWPMYNDVSRL